jgi:MFS transporter, CP family, cyanate transporter
MTPHRVVAASAAASRQSRLPGRLPAVIAVAVIAFSLRTALSSVAPVLNEIMQDTGLTSAGASVLTTGPVLCLGLFAPLAPWLARRVGIERSILLFLLAILAGSALRGLASVPALLAGSLLAGAGIGVGNVLMPGLLKRDFPDQAPLMTGLYIMAMSVGAALAAGTTAPLRAWLGGSWAGALAAWAIPVAIAVTVTSLVWRGRIGRTSSGWTPAFHAVHGLWRDKLAWQVTLFMGLQSMMAYIVFGWMAPILRSRGDSALTGGLVVSVSVLSQVAAALPAPLVAARMRGQGVAAVCVILLAAVSFAALLTAPLSWQWVLAATLGLGQGAAFPIAVLMIVLRAPDSHVAASLSSMSQSVGYTLAACGPLLVGVFHDWTGDWRGAFWLFLASGAAAVVAGALAGRNRLVGAVSRTVTPA